ncbi:MAG: cytochrome c [Sphingomonas sp.]|nr:cytochrome c [Sphingomonas sp.]
MRILFALSAAALAIGIASTGIARPAETAPDASALVAGRQAAFRLNLASFFAIKAAIARGDDVKTLALPSGAIAGWGRALPGLFPAGSMTPTSKALPTVWSDRAGFEAAAADMAAAATKLNDLAKAGDAPGFAAQYAVLGGTCNACHKKYRAEDKH